MERQKSGQNIAIIALAVALVVMTVGFAAASYNQTLAFEGTTNVGTAKWDIHFNTDTYAETAGSVAATSKNVQGTSIDYTITLANPGDFYEFTIDVENLGTFDANLTKVTLSGIDEAADKYLDYTLTYDSTPYTATTSPSGVVLGKSTGKAAVKVRVEYVMPENSSDLPTSGAVLTLNAALDYEQA